MTEPPEEALPSENKPVFLVVDNLPPELECNFEQITPRLTLSVNTSPFSGARRTSKKTGCLPLLAADQAIVDQEVERWVDRMRRFYPAFMLPFLHFVGQRAASRYLILFRELASEHRELCYVSWGYKDLSTGIARHFIPEDRRVELENGFFRSHCLSVTNKELLKRLGVETLRRVRGGRQFRSRFRLLHPQFWEDGVTYFQALKRRQSRHGAGRKAQAFGGRESYDLLIVLQLDFDSATVENGNGWNSLRLLDYINEISRKESVIVRAHPFEKQRKIREIFDRTAQYGFDFSTNMLNQDLAMSSHVVTINSSTIGECIKSGKPFFYGGVIPDELRKFGQPVEMIRAVLDGKVEPVVPLLTDPFDPALMASHIAVRSQ